MPATRFELTYQTLTVHYTNKKAIGNMMRDLKEKNVKNATLTPRGLEYPIGRISLLLRCIGYQQHIEDYPDGITATGQHHLRINVEKILEFFLCDPKTEKPTQKTIHRRWMTPKQYEEQKAKNPTLSTFLL